MQLARLTDVGPLHALAGSWAGSGRWRGEPIELRARGVAGDAGLQLFVTALRDGAVEHSEEATFVVDADGGAAVTRPAPGVEQRWKVYAAADVPRVVLLHGDPDDADVLRLRWTLSFDGPDAYDDTFEIAHPGQDYALDVEARFERVAAPPR